MERCASGAALAVVTVLCGCGTTGSYVASAPPDAGAGSSKAGACVTDVTRFGNAIADDFGRLDGTISAVVEPGDTQCKSATPDAVVVELTVSGAVYKAIIDVTNPRTTTSNPDYFYATLSHPPQDSWAEGWHSGGNLDYPSSLGASTSGTAWTDLKESDLIQKLDGDIPLGKTASVYGVNGGGDAVKGIHYGGTTRDGALLVDPGGANTWLLLRPDGVVF